MAITGESGLAFKGDKFGDRAASAAAAKKALIEGFKAKPAADDPTVLARQAERRAIAEARDVRAAGRRVLKEADDQRRVAEDVARIAADRIRAEEEVARQAEAAARDEAIKAQRKAERDAKYAARKARR